MIIIKRPREIEIMREGGKILAEVLSQISQSVRVGVTTNQLDELAQELILKYKAKPSFKGFQGYPASLCTSINEEVVHSLPSERKLKGGDIISLDLGVVYKGLYTDKAITIGVGEIESRLAKLIEVTREALRIGIAQAKPGNHIGDIGFAISEYVGKNKMGVVRQLVGHGVGKEVHEDPQIPNYGQAGTGGEIKEGMTLAIEPMVTAGNYQVKKSKDGYGFVTEDGSLSAHFEDTIAVDKKGPQILTNL